MDYRERICTLIQKYNYKKIVEVGVWRGALSKKIVKECPKVNHMIMIDPLLEELNNQENYRCTMGEAYQDQDALNSIAEGLVSLNPPFYFIRQKSEDAVQYINDRSVAFVFIDGMHTYENVKQDIELWMPKIKNGGCICGDDYNGHPKYSEGVQRAVNEMLGGDIIVDGRLWYSFIKTDDRPNDIVFYELEANREDVDDLSDILDM